MSAVISVFLDSLKSAIPLATIHSGMTGHASNNAVVAGLHRGEGCHHPSPGSAISG
jgi:hypothetical protein